MAIVNMFTDIAKAPLKSQIHHLKGLESFVPQEQAIPI